ncbi:MAG: L-histidine N(alpha)-methyltransferase [Reyranellaceae bacterium]
MPLDHRHQHTPSPAARGIVDLAPGQESFRDAVLKGLSLPQKAISPKFLYDARGAELFERICEQPEYYPTRTEMALLREKSPEMARLIGPSAHLVEYGSGAGEKIEMLLAALENPEAYVAVDISREQLMEATARLATRHPDLAVTGICADYNSPLPLPDAPNGRRVGFFPGSTIGNFTPQDAAAFLRAASRSLQGGGMLIGVDRKKDKAVLDAAYNDAAGVTEAFIMNLLARMNRELDADFDPDRFRYVAFYNEAEGRIEIYIESLHDQTVAVAGHRFRFRTGERLHSEYSYKYDIAQFQALARAAGFRPQAWWTDASDLFSIHYLAAPPRH